MPRYRKIASYRTPSALADEAQSLGVELTPTQGDVSQIMAGDWSFEDASRGRIGVGNRFTILPMEGWDAGDDGAPNEAVRRRWLRFAASGAKLLWFEASAVRLDGRANPRQLVLDAKHVAALRSLREEAVTTHINAFGEQGLLTGIQLTHSGRWCRPQGPLVPLVAYRHPGLDGRAGVESEAAVASDADLDRLIEDYIAAAVCARDAGFDFVDLKHCHGYLAHELLSAYDRPGPYGGSIDNRLRFLREITAGVRERCPELAVAVRFSAFDVRPFSSDADGLGEPESTGEYRHAFGASNDGLSIDWAEIESLVEHIVALGIGLVSVTAGSPYYCPHVQRPAFYPPSDGYQPPEDPIANTARLLHASRHIKARFPDLGVVGTGFSYLQQHLPAFAAGAIEAGWMDSAGLGRMSLSYPNMPADVLSNQPLARKLICRTFSDCTTAPRNGLVSGCFPLDEQFRNSDAYLTLKEIKRGD